MEIDSKLGSSIHSTDKDVLEKMSDFTEFRILSVQSDHNYYMNGIIDNNNQVA